MSQYISEKARDISYASFLPSGEASIAFLITDLRSSNWKLKASSSQLAVRKYKLSYFPGFYGLRCTRNYWALSRFECWFNRLPQSRYTVLYSGLLPPSGIRYWCIRLPISTGLLYPRCRNETIQTLITYIYTIRTALQFTYKVLALNDDWILYIFCFNTRGTWWGSNWWVVLNERRNGADSREIHCMCAQLRAQLWRAHAARLTCLYLGHRTPSTLVLCCRVSGLPVIIRGRGSIHFRNSGNDWFFGNQDIDCSAHLKYVVVVNKSVQTINNKMKESKGYTRSRQQTGPRPEIYQASDQYPKKE